MKWMAWKWILWINCSSMKIFDDRELDDGWTLLWLLLLLSTFMIMLRYMGQILLLFTRDCKKFQFWFEEFFIIFFQYSVQGTSLHDQNLGQFSKKFTLLQNQLAMINIVTIQVQVQSPKSKGLGVTLFFDQN